MATRLPSLGSKLDSAEAKVRRADQHLRALKQSLKRFTDRNPYAIGAEQHHSDIVVQTARWEIVPPPPSRLLLPRSQWRYRMLARTYVVSVTLTPRPGIDPPLLRWGAIVGDIAHNLSSALDNLVWELTKANPAPPQLPPGASSKQRADWRHLERSIAFPFCDDPQKWPDIRRRCLFFIDPALYTIFEQAQPFYTWQQSGRDPARHPLGVLHELWNGDKHRAVNVVTTATTLLGLSAQLPVLFPHIAELPAEPIELFPFRPTQGKTQVAVVKVHLPEEIEIPAKLEVHVKGEFSLAILFGQGAPGEGDYALDTLHAARNEVVRILNLFA